jgi:predicted RNase H-like nuclease (RuvC/YqgF family)
MTQATDTDIRELKTAIDGNTRAIATQSDRIEVIGRSTEANTKAVELFDRRLEALTKTTEANAKAIEANTKAIADLTLEMRMGFGNVETKFTEVKGQITNLDTKLDGKIDKVESKLSGAIDTLTGKFDERTKGLGTRLDGKELAQRNIFTGLTVTIVGGILLTLGRFLFFGISIKP